MSDKIIVFASFTPKAGAEATVEGILQAMVAPTGMSPAANATTCSASKKATPHFTYLKSMKTRRRWIITEARSTTKTTARSLQTI